ncbi:MAG: Mrp/NBP35 family ATP-binding protein, partial [Clostridia bacterium]|nr:Mrp/NBP35 family ATP-binding protein [Clostridia bacterium]
MGEIENCSHECGSCNSNCNSRDTEKNKDNKKSSNLIASTNEMSSIKKVYGVVSGKGGVGKSLITGLLSTISKRRGYKTAVLDGDITGPSIPKMFG